jgi:hypothetical protein
MMKKKKKRKRVAGGGGNFLNAEQWSRASKGWAKLFPLAITFELRKRLPEHNAASFHFLPIGPD